MKKVKFLVLCLCMAVLLSVAVFAGTYGDLTYTLSDGEVTISYCNESTSGDLVIPAQIDGKPVTTIGAEAFSGCESLTSITIPDSVTSIGNSAFSDCYCLKSVTIPESVMSIGNRTFSDCIRLTSVTIGNGVTRIGESAFDYCYSLTSITIPESVTTIGDYAFSDCYSLTSITLPDGVTSIGNGAFYGCTGLTSITLPESVTSIGKAAFSNSSKLTDFTIYSTDADIYNSKYTFENHSADLIFTCYKDSTAEAYANKYGIPVKYLSAFADESTVYISYNNGSNDNDGLSADSAKKSLGSASAGGALSLVKNGGTVVISEKLYMGADYTLRAFGPITFTANDGTKDYKNASPANNPGAGVMKFKGGASMVIESDLTLDDMILFQEGGQNTFIVKSGATLTVTDKIVCMSKQSFYFKIEVEEGGTAIINGGIFSSVTGDGDIRIAEGVTVLDTPVTPDAPILAAGNARVRAGRTVTVPVMLKQNSGFGGLGFAVSFDKTALTLTDIDQDGALAAFTVTPIETANSLGKVSFNYAGLANVQGDGKIADLTFTVAENAPLGDLPLTLSVTPDAAFVYDGYNMNDLPIAVESGKISVLSYIPGDADGNEVVNIRDAAIILQYLSDWQVEIDLDAADVDGIVGVSVRDAARILQYLSDWPVTLGE